MFILTIMLSHTTQFTETGQGFMDMQDKMSNQTDVCVPNINRSVIFHNVFLLKVDEKIYLLKKGNKIFNIFAHTELTNHNVF